MNGEPDELELLLSRIGDGDLTIEERRRIDGLVARDAIAARTAQQYARLGGLLRTWRVLSADIDWAALTDQISGRLGEPVEMPKDRLDELVRASTDVPAGVNWDGLKARISSAVQHEAILGRERGPRRAMRWIAAVGATTAIAAALLLAVRSAVFESSPSGQRRASIVVTLEVPSAEAGRVRVSFDQTPASAAAATEASGLLLANNGSAVRAAAEPVDDALLF